jgi:hypothetical protein
MTYPVAADQIDIGGEVGMCFHGPNHIIAVDNEQVQRWRIVAPAHPPLIRQAVLDLAGARYPILVGARDEVCVLDGSQTVRYCHAATLGPVAGQRELTGRTGTVLFSSPDDTSHALGGEGFVDVVTGPGVALRALIDQPQATWRPGDLAVAGRAMPVVERCPQARPLWDLLLACLEHRFAGEVRLGKSAPPVRDDDIGIS